MVQYLKHRLKFQYLLELITLILQQLTKELNGLHIQISANTDCSCENDSTEKVRKIKISLTIMNSKYKHVYISEHENK